MLPVSRRQFVPSPLADGPRLRRRNVDWVELYRRLDLAVPFLGMSRREMFRRAGVAVESIEAHLSGGQRRAPDTFVEKLLPVLKVNWVDLCGGDEASYIAALRRAWPPAPLPRGIS